MSYEFIPIMLSGLVLGFSSGIAPGPLLALTVSETLQYGLKAGLKVAVAPLITDAPIVAGSLFILAELKELGQVLAIISILGAFFLMYLGIENLTTKQSSTEIKVTKNKSLQKAIIANFLNPNPYLFWIAIGGPIFLSGFTLSIWNGVIFIFAFYLTLVGSKIILVVISVRMKNFFKSEKYFYLVRITGVFLIAFAIFLLYDGIRQL